MEEINSATYLFYAASAAGTIFSLALTYLLDKAETLSFENYKLREQIKIEIANPRQLRSSDESGGIEDFF